MSQNFVPVAQHSRGSIVPFEWYPLCWLRAVKKVTGLITRDIIINKQQNKEQRFHVYLTRGVRNKMPYYWLNEMLWQSNLCCHVTNLVIPIIYYACLATSIIIRRKYSWTSTCSNSFSFNHHSHLKNYRSLAEWLMYTDSSVASNWTPGRSTVAAEMLVNVFRT
jgi:hypothetical protein